MDVESRSNPFGMDENCENCSALCETRESVVHGHGDVAADFLFVGERPSEAADRSGVPFAGSDAFSPLATLLARVGLCDLTSDPVRPVLAGAYLTYLTRCRHPDRVPTDEEVETCEPYLDAEIRMINPELLIPVGQRALSRVGESYTTRPADELRIEDVHATTIRGRGFELVPMRDPREATQAQRDEWAHAFADVMASDYRQTKGRRER